NYIWEHHHRGDDIFTNENILPKKLESNDQLELIFSKSAVDSLGRSKFIANISAYDIEGTEYKKYKYVLEEY
ncbi:MAG: hypothetical protein L0Z70_08845, partial [Chloroflexi bacterium]|nr:hypothetical protein [Chloroflexota bacterium]